MSQQYARVKEVFLQAVEIPPADQEAFLREQCGNDEQLLHEVATLLEHHDPETIIVPNPRADSFKRTSTIVMDKRLEASSNLGGDSRDWNSFFHGLPDLSDETRQILRRRLWAITLVLCVVLCYVFVRSLLSPKESIFTIRTLCLIVMLACFAALRSKMRLSLFQLRIIELTSALNVAITAGVMDLGLIANAAAQGDVATAVSANNWIYHIWSVLILIYGVFMPNTWQRAACVLLPAACAPYLTTFMHCQWDRQVAEVLSHDRFGMPVPMPFVSAFASVFAAQVIHSVRRDAFRAKQFAQYRLGRLIGVGSFGEVYEAEHLLLKRACAVKLIRPELEADPKAFSRFEREVRAIAKLTHWNSVEVFDFGETAEGMFYYVMELLPGMNLAQMVKRFGPLPPSRAVHFLRQACAALQEAHDLGLVHRDIKPGNLFAAQRGGVWDVTKLLDFGLVRETNVEANPHLTGVNMIAGTPHYMAPEQAAAYRTADARSDIYSLGASGYFLLTGRPPFDGESALKILIAHANEKPTLPSQIRADIPEDLGAVILRCLEKLQENRFQSAADLARALDECDCGKWTDEEADLWWQENPGATRS